MIDRWIWIGLLAAVALAACGGERTIVGEWTGEDSMGNRMTFDFREGGEADWIMIPATEPMRAGTIEMRWDVDRSTSPHHIRFTDFEAGELQGLTLVGIWEFTDDDVFRLDLEPVVQGMHPDSARPDAFTEQTVTFTRVEGGE